MPYDARHHADMQNRTNKAAHRLVACMNDTKWREVFASIARHGLAFQAAWVRDSDWNTQGLHRIQVSYIDTHGLRDPGIGGPCHYRDLLWIRVPRALRVAYCRVPRKQAIEPFLAELGSLGSVPLNQTEEYVEIRGYEF